LLLRHHFVAKPIAKSRITTFIIDQAASSMRAGLKAIVAEVYRFLIGVLRAVPPVSEGSRLDVLVLPLWVVLGILAGTLLLGLLVLLLKLLAQGLLYIGSYLLVAAAHNNEIIKVSAHLTT
jgi:hypothetical protein